jgi:hypothetical protein
MARSYVVLLVVDVGNTQTHFGTYRDGRLVEHWRFTTVRDSTADELGAVLRNLLELLGITRLRKLDRTVSEPEGVSLLAGVPLFAPLARPLLESLAGKLTRIEVPAGTDVVRVGEAGDRFYVIESGRLEATYDGRELSAMGPGECFGEIALLRDVPRTATVTAEEDSVLQALDREDFLAAMSGDTELLGRTESMAARRIQTV